MRIHIQAMALFLILTLVMGCEQITQKKKISNYELGKGKLIEEGDSYKGAKYLKKALDEKPNNKEIRILLIIACRRSIEDKTAKIRGKQGEYEKIMREEFNKLDTERHIRAIIDVINECNIVQKDAMQLLVEKGEKAVKPSIHALIYYPSIHDVIMEVLIQIGEVALDELEATLEKPSTRTAIQLDITRIIGSMKTDKAIPVLEKLADSKDGVVKMEAIASLFERGKGQHKNAIITGLSDPNVEIRRSASRAMIQMNQPLIERLIKTLADQDEQIRINALISIGKNPNTEAIKPLVALLKNEGSDSVKNYIAKALIEIGKAGNASEVITEMINALKNEEEWKVRLTIVRVLKNDDIMSSINQENEYKLWKHHQDTEDNKMVKDEITELLNKIDSLNKTKI